MSLSCVHWIYRCFFVFRSLSSSFFFCSPPVGWRSTLLNKDNETDLYASRACVCVWFSFAHYSCKNISINLNWMLCNEMKRMQNFKQSNDLSILHRCLCWICLSIAHCFLVSFAFAKWMKKKSKSLNWSKRQTRAFHTKEICHIHRYISFYCSVFLFLVLFSPIEFFLVGDFISSLVFFVQCSI